MWVKCLNPQPNGVLNLSGVELHVLLNYDATPVRNVLVREPHFARYFDTSFLTDDSMLVTVEFYIYYN